MWKLEVDTEVNSRHSLARVDCACEVSFLAALPCVMLGVQKCRPYADDFIHVEKLFPEAPRRVIFALGGSPKTLQVQLRVPVHSRESSTVDEVQEMHDRQVLRPGGQCSVQARVSSRWKACCAETVVEKKKTLTKTVKTRSEVS